MIVVQVAVSNLDVVLMEAHGVLDNLSPSLLATLEEALRVHRGPCHSAPPASAGLLRAVSCMCAEHLQS